MFAQVHTCRIILTVSFSVTNNASIKFAERRNLFNKQRYTHVIICSRYGTSQCIAKNCRTVNRVIYFTFSSREKHSLYTRQYDNKLFDRVKIWLVFWSIRTLHGFPRLPYMYTRRRIHTYIHIQIYTYTLSAFINYTYIYTKDL